MAGFPQKSAYGMAIFRRKYFIVVPLSLTLLVGLIYVYVWSSVPVFVFFQDAGVSEQTDRQLATRCKDGCWEVGRGTCDEETGRCNCIGGFSGPTCSNVAMPSCQVAPGSINMCPVTFSCACSLECEIFRLPHGKTCFDELLDDGKVELDAWKLYKRPRVRISAHGRAKEDGKREPVEEEGSKYTHPSACPDMCHARGMCSAGNNTCECVSGWKGDACEVNAYSFPFQCLSNCSGRGECVGHVCLCHQGYFGADCSLYKSKIGVTEKILVPPYVWTDVIPSSFTEGRVREPKIYVYELPGEYNMWLLDHSPPSFDFPEEILFLEKMLASPYRTLRGEEADFFYVPVFLRNREGTKEDALNWAIEYIRSTWQFYDQLNGENHMFLVERDWTDCNATDSLLAKSIAITLRGKTGRAGTTMTVGDTNPCFIKGQDISIPPFVDPEIYSFSPWMSQKSEVVSGGKSLLFYKGKRAREEQDSGPLALSMKVSEKMFDLYGGKGEPGIHVVEDVGDGNKHWKEMSNSVFCLAPGGGHSEEATEALSLGCIPVVILQPELFEPFEGDLLSWSSISVQIQLEDLHRIAEILKAIPAADVKQRLDTVATSWTRFVWSSPQYNPFSKFAKNVQNEWVPSLADKDVHASVVSVLGQRMNSKATLSSCTGQCDHGYCNEEQGLCQCLGGYKGPNCAELALPSCHFASDVHTRCHVPTSCACVAECESYDLPHQAICFDEKGFGGNTKMDLQELYKRPQVKILFDEDGKETARVPVTDDELNIRSGKCGEDCSVEVGWCACAWLHGVENALEVDNAAIGSTTNHCSEKANCSAGSVMAECSAHLGTKQDLRCQVVNPKITFSQESSVALLSCFNSCSGRGKCIDGTCKCTKGFFGLDCSLFVGIHKGTRKIVRSPLPWAAAVKVPSSTAKYYPKIYVYEIPHHLNTWQFLHTSTMDFSEHFYFIERLLASGHRTADPEEAHYFFIPLIHKHQGGNSKKAIAAVLDYLKERWRKFWLRKGGEDHIVLVNGDWGLCEMGDYGLSEPSLSNLIVLTLWGQVTNMNLEYKNSCFTPGKDIVIPPVMTDEVYKYIPYLRKSEEREERKQLLYFQRWGGEVEGVKPFGPYSWSLGVVQKIFSVYGGQESATGVYLEEGRKGSDSDNGSKQMRRSVFCLAPSGWGWSVYATQAILMGCIPVVVQPFVVQPFERDIDWEALAVFLLPDDIPTIHSILKAISNETIASKQKACENVWYRFVWSSPSLNPLKEHRSAQDEDGWALKLEKNDVLGTVMQILWSRYRAEDSFYPSLKTRSVTKQTLYKLGMSLPERFKEDYAIVEFQEPGDAEYSACPAGCLDNGSCNEETGVCECKGGYAGPTCNELAMPACFLSPDYYTPCLFMTTCACKLQCDSYRMGTAFTCFDEKRDDGRVETDIAKLFDSRQVVLSTDSLGHEFGPRRAIPESEWRHEVAAPSECPLNCSGRGMCYPQDKTCRCAWTHYGYACSPDRSSVFHCFNECNGRGECSAGVCKCNKGFFGLDCALSLDRFGVAEVITRPPFSWSNAVPESIWKSKAAPKIYVYELPGYFNTWQFAHTGHLDWQEPIYFLERILVSNHRTANPMEADYFFFPLILRPRGAQGPPTLEWAISYVRERYPFFNRSNGADHMVVTNSDWGNCEVGPYGRRSPLLTNMVGLTLWGHTKNMELTDQSPCFIVGQDVALPPRMDHTVYPHIPFLKEIQGTGTEASPSGSDQRKTLLYFNGYSALERSDPLDVGYSWSFGVRQKMFMLYENRENETGIRLVGSSAVKGDYLVEMETSLFCFAPSGWGWGMRTTQVIMLGCIPVVIQPNVVQPFEIDLLDWNEFAVVLTKEDIPRLSQILKAISPEEIRAKQKGCARVWPKFVWSSFSLNPLDSFDPQKQYPQEVVDKMALVFAEGDAFECVMDSLGRRVRENPFKPFWKTKQKLK